jgi:hypothetical protein
MTHIATIPKNSREELRVSLDEYQGHRLINMRIWFDAGEEMRPGKKGLSLKLDALPELLAALQNAEKEALRLGLMEGAA